MEASASNNELIPWKVGAQHRWAYPAFMLAAEVRRRAGEILPPDLEERLERWLTMLLVDDLVVAYDPGTEEGFYYAPRQPDDADLIRRPTT